MKNFTETDVNTSGQFPTIYADSTDLLESPLDWQRRGLQETASGYGAKLTSSRKIQFNGKFYRLYVTCYGNAGSTWFTVRGRKIWVN